MPSNHKTLKKSLVALLISGALATLGYISTSFGLLNGLFELRQNISQSFLQKKAEDNLQVIYTGSSIKYIESIFGVPVKEEHSDDGRLNEYIYSFSKFYMQVVYDGSNTVIFYSVTSKSKDFHPKIPYLEGVLGDRYNVFGDDIIYLDAGASSKFYQYEEGHYLGNPGNYRNFYLAYNPAGVDYVDLKPLPDFHNDNESPPSQKDLKLFRSNNAPNTFGIGDIQGSPEGPELHYGIGIDYFDARDIPSKD